MPSPPKQQKVGLLGGSFDPVHCGHLLIARQLLAKYQLEQIIFIPCRQQTLKTKHHATAEQRFAMLELALADEDKLIVDDVELKQTPANYTINTVRYFQQQAPNTEFYWIMGSDCLQQLSEWHQSHALVRLCQFIIVERPGFMIQAKLADNFHRSNIKPPELSSTEVRTAVMNQANYQSKLPASVAAYIDHNKLYQIDNNT